MYTVKLLYYYILLRAYITILPHEVNKFDFFLQLKNLLIYTGVFQTTRALYVPGKKNKHAVPT